MVKGKHEPQFCCVTAVPQVSSALGCVNMTAATGGEFYLGTDRALTAKQLNGAEDNR